MRARPHRLGRRWAAVALSAALGWSQPAALGRSEASGDQPSQQQHRWLEEIAVLLQDYERATFEARTDDYERQRFMRRFWQVRDPDRSTPRNEFREIWDVRVDKARRRFGGLEGDRARTLLLLGPPGQTVPLLCLQALYPLEVWAYPGTADLGGAFHLVFANTPESGAHGARLWGPGEGLGPLLSSRVAGGADAPATHPSVCVNGEEILSWLAGAANLTDLQNRLALPPDPGEEWTLAFAGRTATLPADAVTFPAQLSIRYPARRGQRTVLQGLIRLTRQEAIAGIRRGRQTYSFLLDGRVVRDGALFEDFRYRFDIPSDELEGDEIALVIERSLRPGVYELVLKVEDVHAGSFFRQEVDLRVPGLEQAPATPPVERPIVAASPGAEAASFELLEEANRTLEQNEHRLRIRPPVERLLVGGTRIVAEAAGEGIAKVRFLLNGRPVMSKTRPPYAVEINLGPVPRVHLVEAVALDSDGGELARDQVPLNAGPHRFAVRLLEPRPGASFRRSLRAHVEVRVPEGQEVDRVELYLNETLLTTLFQRPYLHPLLLPRVEEMSYLRAVAYLKDGLFAEDLVILNSPPGLDRIRVDFIELYTSVVNRRGQPVLDLSRDEIRVLEEGVLQTVRRFERVAYLPIHATVALDTSTSMRARIRAVESAARQFLSRLIGPKDRASIVAFNDRPELLVPFTADQNALSAGLEGLATEGETALFDSVVFGLYNFGGITGKRALVLFSDGADTASEFDSETALDYARHAGVAIYTIALQVKSSDLRSRLHLEHLAAETGGRSFFIDDLSELERVYSTIEAELRSQYLLAYQSSAVAGSDFRRVKVEIDRPGHTARTIPGYYP
ncbi:MAG: VWA domain-containing protein [Thermoanaerobaculia bacterium]